MGTVVYIGAINQSDGAANPAECMDFVLGQDASKSKHSRRVQCDPIQDNAILRAGRPVIKRVGWTKPL